MARRRQASQRIVKNLERRRPFREPGKRILVVCEGAKTEPNYIEGWRRSHHQRSVTIQIVPSPDCTPVEIVETAIDMAKRAKYDRYDHVFCVYDRDQHASFDDARSLIDSSKCRRLKIEPAYSIPCFEYFLILHFSFTTKPFENCDQAISELKKFIPHYTKNDPEIYDLVGRNTQEAIENCRKARREVEKVGAYCPITLMDMLIDSINPREV